MLRHPSLIPLSHQHHNGLALCVLTRRSLAADSSAANLARLARRVIDRYEIELTNHFEIEEQTLFPQCANQPLVDELIADHRAIEALVEQLRAAPSAETLEAFCELLSTHIRREERELFEQAQRDLAPAVLEKLGAEIDRRVVRVCLCALLLLTFGVARLHAQLTPDAVAQIDRIAEDALHETGSPSVSLALVKDGKLAYARGYGKARLDPPAAAQPQMRYKIGSVSKQFLAAAILLLVQDGKLSLDDPVGKYMPGLTRGDEITIRQLLSHTSGYQDYYPLDFVAPFMLEPVTAAGIVDRWARKPLDFDPGTQWQYSNTNYVIAGLILEKVSGMPMMDFLRTRIFRPLGMNSVVDLNHESLTPADAQGYGRYVTGPVHPAVVEAQGWVFAAGELAMTPRDLALWDISLLDRKLLSPASLDQMMNAPRLKSGAPQNYALGVSVTNSGGFPVLSHGGAVSGFTSVNTVWMGRGAAIAVFANDDITSATRLVSGKIADVLLKEQLDPGAATALAQAKSILAGLQNGRIDKSLFSADGLAYFTPEAIAAYAAILKPLGTPTSFEQTAYGFRGGMAFRNYRVGWGSRTLRLLTFLTPEGKLAQYLIVK